MQACGQELWGTDNMWERTIVLQGLGKAAVHLAKRLAAVGAKLIGSNIDNTTARYPHDQLNVTIAPTSEILHQKGDILATCALGGTLKTETVPNIRYPVICGVANDQLPDETVSQALLQNSILYAPDYVPNGRGIINLSFELKDTGYNEAAAMNKVRQIRETMEKIISLSKRRQLPTSQIGDRLAEERINSAKLRQ